jgi:hypothetical protein
MRRMFVELRTPGKSDVHKKCLSQWIGACL